MSTPLLRNVLLSVALLVTTVRPWPYKLEGLSPNLRQQRDVLGNGSMAHSYQPFGDFYSSNQQDSRYSKVNSPSQVEYLNQFLSNHSNSHATPHTEFYDTLNTGIIQPSDIVAPHSFTSHPKIHGQRHSNVHGQAIPTRNNQQNVTATSLSHQLTRGNIEVSPVNANPRQIHQNMRPSVRNNQRASLTGSTQQKVVTAPRSAEAASRGNRRVVTTNNPAVQSQAIANANEGVRKSNNRAPLASISTTNNSWSNQRLQEARTQSNGGPPVIRNRNQSLHLPLRSNGAAPHRDSIQSQQQLPAQGRIVTSPSNTREKQSVASQRPPLKNNVAYSSSTSMKGNNMTAIRPGGEAIVFPDAKYKPHLGNDRRPPCATINTYCTEVDDYPTPHLNTVLKNEPLYSEFFGNDSLLLGQRLGVDGEPMCKIKEMTIFPKLAQNKDEEWLYVVNLDKEYIQGVHIELCSEDNSSCELSSGLPPGYLTSCRQKFIYRRLLAVKPDGKPAPDSFRLPSCCACYFHQTPLTNRLSDLGRQ